MRRLRLLIVACLVALFAALPGLGSPAWASHKCAEPDIFEDDPGITDTVTYVCDYGIHDPVGVAKYVFCWISPTC